MYSGMGIKPGSKIVMLDASSAVVYWCAGRV